MNFWAQFPQGQCFPSCGCEPLLPALIMQPQAFWSSLAYALVAFLVYRRCQLKSFGLRVWIVTLLYLTVASMFAHASYLKVALAMDFSAIVILLSLFSVLNLLRRKGFGNRKVTFLLAVYVVFLVSFFSVVYGWLRITISILIFAFAFRDLWKELRHHVVNDKSRPFWISMAILGVSFLAFIGDTTHLVCDANGWIHGHTLWHMGTAMSAYYYSVWRFHLPRKFRR